MGEVNSTSVPQSINQLTRSWATTRPVLASIALAHTYISHCDPPTAHNTSPSSRPHHHRISYSCIRSATPASAPSAHPRPPSPSPSPHRPVAETGGQAGVAHHPPPPPNPISIPSRPPHAALVSRPHPPKPNPIPPTFQTFPGAISVSYQGAIVSRPHTQSLEAGNEAEKGVQTTHPAMRDGRVGYGRIGTVQREMPHQMPSLTGRPPHPALSRPGAGGGWFAGSLDTVLGGVGKAA